MTQAQDNVETPQEASRSLLSRRDWVYLLSLLVPFILYDLVLKGALVFSRPEDPGFWGALGLMRSDLLFNLGYALLWIGLFAIARRGASRWVVVGLFHLSTLLVALITTSAYQYFKVTGSTLDSDYIYLWLYSPEGTGGAIASELTTGILVVLAAILLYTILGPWLVTWILGRWRGLSGGRLAGVSWLRVAGVGLAVYALFSFSLLPGGGSTGASKSFSRDALVNVIMTATEVAEGQSLPDPSSQPVEAASEASLKPVSSGEKRNVAMIFLESTRAGATTAYNSDLSTTPFLASLADRSLLVNKAYTVVPHTHNALAATNCGIAPPLDPWGTKVLSYYEPPTACLPELLSEQGYNNVYFMSQEGSFENSPKILENIGYEEFRSVDTMDKEGFEKTNYFGYEDEVMLEPSKEWLEENGDEPFLATYLTSAPHHDYLAPEKRYGSKQFTNDELINRYLNSVRNQDFFLKNLFDQYKELGLYEDTVFVIVGDHGEAFGEHGRYQHDNAIYEEGLRVPLIIHDPRRFEEGARLTGPVNQLDLLPTVADLLGYEVQGGKYPGYSLLGPIPANRTLMASCWNAAGCLASIKGTEKYIYHFDDKPEELFDLSKDPAEKNNLAAQNPQEVEKRRQELLEWRSGVYSTYGIQPPE